MFSYIRRKFKEIIKAKKKANVVEALTCLQRIKVYIGLSAFTVRSTPGGYITTTFSSLGFLFALITYLSYYYCAFTVVAEDQTILRRFFNTKLKHYGDQFEILATTVLVLYSMWKIPYDLSGNTSCMQTIVDIDKSLEDLGEYIDHTMTLITGSLIPFIQIIFSCITIITIYTMSFDTYVPSTKVYQKIYSDFIAYILMAHSCFYLFLLKVRYHKVNKVLQDIAQRKSPEYFMFFVNKGGITSTGSRLQVKYVCERIKACGKIYNMLYNATNITNKKFGFAVTVTMVWCLFYIILYLYYFMEATASGLFHEPKTFVDFMVYVMWQFGYSLIIIFICIYFCQTTVDAAKVTSTKTHEIINNNMDPSITREAVYLSLQTLHQTPVFTASGLTKINYELLLEGTKSVTTFLVIMLQFVTDTHGN